MALLFGKELRVPHGRPTHVITDVLVLEQEAGAFHVQPTARGATQITDFMAEHRSELVCLGWAHSHHQPSIVEQGRLPSATDVQNHYDMKLSYPTANLMLITNDDGWDAFTLPHGGAQVISHHGGKVAETQADIHDRHSRLPLCLS